jgi:hypothetical protein
MKKTGFYITTLAVSLGLFLMFGFLPTDCTSAGNSGCTVAGTTDVHKPIQDCSFNGLPLHGKVQFVESFPDIKIQYVESFPDLKVKFVESFPDECGEWQIVESFPDIKVQVVTSFPDIKVKVVESFPGLP